MLTFARRMKIISAPYNCLAGNNGGESAFLLQGPLLEALPDCALLRERWPFFVPDWDKRFVAHMQLAVRIDRLGKDIAERFAHRYYGQVTAAVRFCSADHPAVVFDGCVATGKWTPPQDQTRLRLEIDGHTVQTGEGEQMAFGIDRLIAHASRFLTLKTGDIILCGPCSAEGTLLREGQTLTAWLNDEPLLHMRIK